MSTAFYPQGMKTYNNYLPSGGYKTWKGTGYFSNPTGITWGNMRPFTNRDLLNNVIYKQGATRPLKQYRRGISIVSHKIDTNVNPNKQNIYNEYQENREVKTSRNSKLVSQIMEYPGCCNVLENKIGEQNNITELQTSCEKFHGVGMVTNIYPNVNYLEKPPVILAADNQPIAVDDSLFCCNLQKNALRMVRSSTNLKKNYYTTSYQYLQNRCKTYNQRVFNFVVPGDYVAEKPGSPLSIGNYYVANCLPNFIIRESIEIAFIDMISKKIITTYPEYEDKIYELKNAPDLTFYDFLIGVFQFIDTLNGRGKEITFFVNRLIIDNSDTIQNILTTANRRCGKVVYKPNNFQFAVEGAVSSSTQILKRNVTTLNKYGAEHRAFFNGMYTPVFCEANCGNNLNIPLVLKTKGSTCVKNGRCNGILPITAYGKRVTVMSRYYPELYNTKYMPNYAIFQLKRPQ